MITEVSPTATVTLDGSGGGQCALGPPSGTKWALRLATVATSTAVKQPTAKLYRGSPSGPIQLLDSAQTGSAASSGKVAGAIYYPGQLLWAVWSGGDAGAIATLQAFGQQANRSDPLAPSPLAEGFPPDTVILTLPFGATSGARIVLNGQTGEIDVYDAANNLRVQISTTGPNANLLQLFGVLTSDLVLETGLFADNMDRFNITAAGIVAWGAGVVITDCYLARKAAEWMEFGNRLDLRSFGALTDTMFGVRRDGEVNPRALIRTDGQMRWGGGTAGTDVGLFRRTANELSTDGDFSLSALGAGILIKEGANCTLGEATLVAGTVTIANTNVTATCRIFVNRRTAGGALGHLSTTISAGVSFTVTSSSATETSTFDWLILYPA